MSGAYKLVIVKFLLVGVVFGQLKRGDDCQLKGRPGVCKLLTECPQAEDDARNDILSRQCEYEGLNAVVCCDLQPQKSRAPRLIPLPGPLGAKALELGAEKVGLEAPEIQDLPGEIGGIIGDHIMNAIFDLYKNTATYMRDIKNKPQIVDKVIFDLYTNENPKEALTLDPDRLERFKNRNHKIVFLIHGWLNSRDTPWMSTMKDAFLNQYKDSWVIIVDWKWPALQPYSISAISTYDVSKKINELLINLYKRQGVDKKNFLLVGHSLGGQITGFVGRLFHKETQEKLPKVVALDPAGPMFTTRPEDKRLNKHNAEIVEVIHTDGDLFGYRHDCGTIDFYVNGGMKQPGCRMIDMDHLGKSFEEVACDHMRAVELYSEVVQKPTAFVAKKCSSMFKFNLNQCAKETVPMGDLNTTETGKFFLKTNSKYPFSEVGDDSFLPPIFETLHPTI